MNRYFIEVSYHGKGFSGFQIQDESITIQGEVNKAFETILKKKIETTTSSRTDAGVHALQNFLHLDIEDTLPSSIIYNLNALLPIGISVNNIFPVHPKSHARFDALGRRYSYQIIPVKQPFRHDRAYFYPFAVNKILLEETAQMLLQVEDFTSFSKKKTDVKTFLCKLSESHWEFYADGSYVYQVSGNRFLRGMVRALVGTQLQVARGRITVQEFQSIIDSKDCTLADFSARPEGLFLEEVQYPPGLLGRPLPRR
ncbi:MAG: tRNA pseudouridine(38-40) synthase TruA [Chitinophagaceae bacterium]|nr:tRNA pseudouridine(38-40) synthase TruA [Chitinophagaceae bacterium]